MADTEGRKPIGASENEPKPGSGEYDNFLVFGTVRNRLPSQKVKLI